MNRFFLVQKVSGFKCCRLSCLNVLPFILLFIVCFSQLAAAQNSFISRQGGFLNESKQILFFQNTNSISPPHNHFFGNIQESVLKRRFRLALTGGIQIVESPVSASNDVFYGISLHTLIYRTGNLESYILIEGAHAQGNEMKTIPVDEDEAVELKSLNTTTFNLNLEFVGINWIRHNFLHIFPYSTFGVGVMSRPEKTKETTRHFDVTEEENVTITMKDIERNNVSINLGVGFQIYYLARFDFRIFLVHPGSVAIYRLGLKFIF